MIQKLRVEPPTKFSGRENFDSFFKRFVNYMSLTDENFGFIMGSIKDRLRTPFTAEDYDTCGQTLSLESGTSAHMSRVMYYTLGSGSLLEEAP